MSEAPRILISRSDAIGDVVLTLPLAAILKQRFPGARIGFLGKAYTKAVIACCSAVDEFVDVEAFLQAAPGALRAAWDVIIHVFPRKDIAMKAFTAGISVRIGTSSRPYHWLSCNRKVRLSRRNSQLHEAVLNTKLLAPLGITAEFTEEELGRMYAFDRIPALPLGVESVFLPGKRYVILHPKSQGSAREWGTDQFLTLVRLLPRDEFQIFISGTAGEGTLLGPFLHSAGDAVTDMTGKMDLAEFIAFIARCDALVAASTGPLHLAAALGKRAIGIYPPIRPMHAGRWGPLGPGAVAMQLRRECSDCRKAPQGCQCMSGITATEVAQAVMGNVRMWECENG